MIDSPDGLWSLLPAYIRQQDLKNGGALRQWLAVVADQAILIEQDLERMLDDCFIETCQDWVVPYIADLLGYVAPPSAGTAGGAATPRREVGALMGLRRRKGAAAIVEQLARDVAGWPARSQEYFSRLAVCQHLDHVHSERVGFVDLHSARDLRRLADSPFGVALLGDLRRAASPDSPGDADVAGLGVAIRRARAFRVTRTTAYCIENAEHCFTFSILGNDAPLFGDNPDGPAEIGRLELENDAGPDARAAAVDPARYGPERDFAIWAKGWPSASAPHAPLPAASLLVADLSGWSYKVPRDRVAVDPVLGRIMFAKSQASSRPLRVAVSYNYGFALDIGGGEYARPPLPMPAWVSRRRVRAREAGPPPAGEFGSLAEAAADWRRLRSAQRAQGAEAEGETAFPALVVELVDSGLYGGALDLELGPGESVWLIAGPGARPALWLSDADAGGPDALSVRGGAGSRFVMDGLMLAGRGLRLSPGQGEGEAKQGDLCEVLIRHCTLVPGWGLTHDCEPARPADPSIVVDGSRLCLRIERSIVGAIHFDVDLASGPPAALEISDSVVDATSETRTSIGASGDGVAGVCVSLRRATVVGAVAAHQVGLIEDSLCLGVVTVARRQAGQARYSYFAPGSRTPRTYMCQPAAAFAEARARYPNPAEAGRLERVLAALAARVPPRFLSTRYGRPDYLRLTACASPLIARGASDGGEMGVYHELFEPQRLDRLTASLDEYTPAEFDAAMRILS